MHWSGSSNGVRGLDWVYNIVCVVWTWIKKMVCVAWEYVKAVGCATATSPGPGVPHAAAGLGGIPRAHARARPAASWVGAAECSAVKPADANGRFVKGRGIHIAVFHTGKVLLFSYDEGVLACVGRPTTPQISRRRGFRPGAVRLFRYATATAKYVPLNETCSAPTRRSPRTEGYWSRAASSRFPGFSRASSRPNCLRRGGQESTPSIR